MNPKDRLYTLRRRATGLAAAVLAPALVAAAPLGTVAQDETPVLTLRSYPLAIHQGTCETVVTAPSYPMGYLVPRALYLDEEEVFADDEAYDTGLYDPFVYGDFYPTADADVVEDDEVLDEALLQNEIGEENADFLFDDVDDDGLLDYGLDVDDNDVLDRVEVIDRPVVWAYENELNDISPDLLDDEGLFAGEEGEDPELDDLRAIPHVVMVHRTDFFDTEYMACGEISGAEGEEGWIVFAIRPLTDSSFVGIARFEEDEAGFLGIGGEGGAANVYLIPSATANVVGQPPSAADTGAAQAEGAALAVTAGETGFEPATLTAPAGDVAIAVTNPLDVERTFVIPDLGIEETLAPGETTEVVFEATEPGVFEYGIEGEDDLVGELEITE